MLSHCLTDWTGRTRFAAALWPLRTWTLVLSLAGVGPAAAAPATPASPTEPLPGPATRVLRPTSRGKVTGFVLDARTRQPLPQARIRVEEGSTFADAGPTVGQTDAKGRYSVRARIGRSWRKIDWMRVFTSFPPLILLQPKSVTKQSRSLLATRLNVRVEREGYQPFVGEVPAERLDAGKFSVLLHDIWLAPTGSGTASFSPTHLRHEYVESFRIEPAVAKPGDTVTITARIHIPFERGGRYRVYYDSSESKLVRTGQALKVMGPPDPKSGVSTFQRTVKLPRKPRAWSSEISPWISLDYREIPVGWEFRELLQVVQSEEETAVAERVAAGYRHLARREPGAAVQALREATEQRSEYAPAYRYLGEAYQNAGRPHEAARAYERLVALAPEDVEIALPRYAEALLDSGQLDAAARALEAGARRSKRLPAGVALARARLSARRGDIRAADVELARAGRGGRIPRPVQREIALRRAEAALREAPDSPDAELALARALADLDRWDEAAGHARRACDLRPDEAWPLVELAALQRRLGRPASARATLERALALDPNNGDASLSLAEVLLTAGESDRARELFARAAERRPYDFRARHGLALAELRRAMLTPKSQGTGGVCMAAALEQLRAAAVIGRGKGEVDSGFQVPIGVFTVLHFGPKRQTIEGFDRQEAADDYQLIQALERLQEQPEDALAHYSAGTALARLGQQDMALASLERAALLRPELADLSYWRAVALLELRRPLEARAALAEAVRDNPLHPYAHRLLAQLCLDAGELEQAQAHLIAHRRHWPHERAPEPEVLEQ